MPLGQRTTSCVRLGQQFMRAYLYSSNTLCNEALVLCNFFTYTERCVVQTKRSVFFSFDVVQANTVTLIKMSFSGESQ